MNEITIPQPTENIQEIVRISQAIQPQLSLSEIRELHFLYGEYNHPHIQYDFGIAFYSKGEIAFSKQSFLKGAYYGVQFPSTLYNTPFIDSVGQCFAHLITHFNVNVNPIVPSPNAYNTVALAYIYLSKCIELFGREAHDSYKTRARLFLNSPSNRIMRTLVEQNLGLGVVQEPFMISDMFFAASGTNSPFKADLFTARDIHNSLGSLSISRKDADEYTIEEMSLLGEIRHKALLNQMRNKYEKGRYDMTAEGLNSL